MSFEKVTPESVGIPSTAVLGLMDELKSQGVEMHALMILRHGKNCAEAWWKPYSPDAPHIMFSFSKSLTSTAIGFLEQEGKLSLDERLVDIFPEHVPENPSKNLKKCTVEHLLMMGCGHETEIDTFDGTDSWIKLFLHHPFVFEPGTKFMYNTAGTNMLSAILTKKTGQKLTEFLRPRLMDPLDMSKDIACFEIDGGIEAGGFGYKLRTEDMARFVQFVLNRGSWEGKQLLRAEWFERATAKQIENNDSGNPNPDWASGYGYRFWRCSVPGVFRGDGAFGQFGVVIPDKDTAVIINSSSIDLQPPLCAIYQTLLPYLGDEVLPENSQAYSELQFTLATRELSPMLGVRAPQSEKKYDGVRLVPAEKMPAFTTLIGGAGRFVFEDSEIQSLRFRFGKGKETLEVTEKGRSYSLPLGLRGTYDTVEIGKETFGVNSCWRFEDKLEMHIRNIHTASGKRFLISFGEREAVVNAESTVPEGGGLGDDLIPDSVWRIERDDA